jgi:hypothetical protein
VAQPVKLLRYRYGKSIESNMDFDKQIIYLNIFFIEFCYGVSELTGGN